MRGSSERFKSVYTYMQQVASNVVDGIAGIDLPNFNVLIQELKRGVPQLYKLGGHSRPIPRRTPVAKWRRPNERGEQWRCIHNGDTGIHPDGCLDPHG
ncbi:hypothetical protein MHU86_15579 [Fragilaria crotonensis]|nr:hypothetical protein MHU86_15579 [Fragilaria crotonensis]